MIKGYINQIFKHPNQLRAFVANKSFFSYKLQINTLRINLLTVG